MGALGVRCCHSLEFGQDRHFLRVRRFILVDPATRGEALRRWMMRPKDASFSGLPRARLICCRSAIKVEPVCMDSLLEGAGFELFVPLGISSSPSWWGRARKPHGAPEGSFSVAGPIVRIHLPPAASQANFRIALVAPEFEGAVIWSFPIEQSFRFDPCIVGVLGRAAPQRRRSPSAYRPASRSKRMTGLGVRREKAALSSGCKAHPAIRSSRKQSEQSWR
jgi:hypothetical protein